MSFCILTESGFHLKHQLSTVHNVLVGDVVLFVFLSVKINLVHIEILFAQILRHHGECLSVGKIEGDGGKLGRTEDILGTDGIHRIESHGREHIPGRHLSAVVVAAQSVWLGKILGVEDLTHKFCRTFGTSCHGIEVYNVVARLVSVRILANESAHIAYGADQGNGEERIKFIEELLLATEKLDETRHIMLYMPGILPCIAFGVIHSAILGTAHCAGVEGIEPFAVTLAGAHETDTLVEEVLVIVGALGKVGLYQTVNTKISIQQIRVNFG